MGFLQLAQQLDPKRAAQGGQQAVPVQPPRLSLVPGVQETPQQDVSQYRPEVIAPPGVRNIQAPQPQSVGQAPMPREYGAQYDSLFKPGPLQQQYTQAAQAGPGPAPKGFLGHLKGASLGFLLGGVPGAVAGAISPGIPQRAVFRGIQLPQLVQQADQEMQQQGMQRQGYHALAQSTGYDPITHAPTLPMLQAQAMNNYRLGGLEARNRGLDIQQQRADEATRAHDMTEQYRQARLRQFQEGLQNGSHVLAKGADGNQYVVDKNNPSDAILVADSAGNPIGSIDQMLEGGRNYRASQSNALRQQGLSIQQQNANTNAGRAGEAARHNRATESQAATNEIGRGQRAKGRMTIFGIPATDGGQATPQAAPQAKRLTRADVQAYANANYKGDYNAAKARIQRDNPDWIVP